MAGEKKSYFSKWRGVKARSGLPYPRPSEALVSGLGAFTAIAVLSYLTFEAKIPILIAPFGASTFIIFAAPAVPFSQPRNVVGGHVLSASVGVACSVLLGSSFWAVAFACGMATALMVATKTWHPPAGGTAILPVMTANNNWVWILYPTGLGAAILVIIGLLYNNLIKSRNYPAFWW